MTEYEVGQRQLMLVYDSELRCVAGWETVSLQQMLNRKREQ